ncbi:hypothetical protein Taro_032663 [Colocasia esculenta]|uniref:Uncharacterized protein n=1 Tax=Colocasia esculenta TaxID=4460 RepID=A0A843W4K9_COLES|nr:hypothetical protein [Colocasia esculenta]
MPDGPTGASTNNSPDDAPTGATFQARFRDVSPLLRNAHAYKRPRYSTMQKASAHYQRLLVASTECFYRVGIVRCCAVLTLAVLFLLLPLFEPVRGWVPYWASFAKLIPSLSQGLRIHGWRSKGLVLGEFWGGLTMTEYHMRFVSLMRHVSSIASREQVQTERFIAGLRPELRSRLRIGYFALGVIGSRTDQVDLF